MLTRLKVVVPEFPGQNMGTICKCGHEDGPIRFAETLATEYQYRLCNILQDRLSYLHQG